MSYASKFLNAHGKECTILRNPQVTSKISMKLATQSVNGRDKFREGIILANSELTGGEIIADAQTQSFDVDGEAEANEIRNPFLIRSVVTDEQSGQIAFLASKANSTLIHKRYSETVDGWGKITKSWSTITDDVYCDAQIVTADLKQEDPGLLETTKWLFLIPDSVDIQELDRLQFKPGGDLCQVDVVDNTNLPGLLRVQCSVDVR